MADLVIVRDPQAAAPKFRVDLVCWAEPGGNRPGYTVEDPLRGKFFHVGAAEFGLLRLLDGETSIAEAVGLAAADAGSHALGEHEALALCHWAVENQLVRPGGEPCKRIEAAAAVQKRRKLAALLNPLCVRLPLFDPDRFLARIVGIGGRIFTWPAFAVWAAALGYAGYLIASDWPRVESAAAVVLDRDNWLRLAVAWIVLKIVHETAHGLACKRYGGTVRSAGVTLLFFVPLAYVDVTSSWRFASRWQRVITSAAGIYADLFAAALATIVWASASPGVAQTMALNVALTAGVSTLLFNANPLVRFDGYFVLSDLLEIPNLYARSQQWIADFVQTHVLGREAPALAGPRAIAWFIPLYAIAALAWRMLFFLTLALVIAGAIGQGGAIVAGLLLGIAWGWPLVQLISRLRQAATFQAMNRRRAIVSMSIAAAAMLALALLLTRPARVFAPAVAEYAPLTIVRAAAPGFIDKIFVADGEQVAQGQPLFVLRNDALAAELADLELACEESLVKSRMHVQAQDAAQQQMETADRRAMQKKLHELKQRVDSLTVRAPAAGRVYARNLDALIGRYLATGDEIAVLGREESKELLVAVPQDDVELFEHRLGRGEIRVSTASGERFAARLVTVDPRGENALPHPAFSAAVGGPLAVKAVARTTESAAKPDESFELVSPVFLAKAELPATHSLGLHAGERLRVSFATEDQTLAGRYCRLVQAWAQRLASGSHEM